ncbi:uncharacterized protein NPIL_200771 [Nephila pilipes]|uniref:DUF5641 domain-containing protein n=1 Tax=Nephila pilipes TaxID=299642 RepID=A0A8X6NH94_NEPPI|nr:uncharacterized protein NPIL_200771 [Nephila pilipes]
MKQKYWIVGAKTAIRREVRRCVTSARFSSEFSKQIIADLPAVRVNPGRVFLKIAASDDSSDFSVIIPGHFLIGSELKSVPEPDYTSEKIPIRERWKFVAQISQSFWKSWLKDHLTQLQVRNKWKVPSAELSVNDLVLIKDDKLHHLSGKWQE